MKIISFIFLVEKGLKPYHSRLFSDLILNLLPRLTKEGYVTVENVEATLQKVEALGGKVLMRPIQIPPNACFALIQDPQGATLAIISYGAST